MLSQALAGGYSDFEFKVFTNTLETAEPFQFSSRKAGWIIYDSGCDTQQLDFGKKWDLKIKEINPDIKILLSSGYSINGQVQEILDRGCDGFIQKTFNMKQLSRKIREILEI